MPRSLVRLLIKYFLIIISPVLILSVLGYVSIYLSGRYAAQQMGRLTDTSLLQIERVSDQLYQEVRATAIALGTADSVLRVLQDHEGRPAMDLSDLRELELVRNLVNTSAHARPQIKSIYIYLEGFESVLTTDSEIQRLSRMIDRSWLTEYESQEPEVLTWAARRIYTPLGESGPQEPVISVYQRLFTFSAGNMPGVVVLNLKEQALLDLIQTAAISRRQQIAILDERDRLVVSNLVNTNLLQETLNAIAAGNTTVGDGKDTLLLSSRASDTTGWRYIMLTPRSIYLAPVTGMVRLNLIFVTVAVFLGFGVAAVMTRRSFGFIREVVDVIERSEAGLDLPSTQGHDNTGFSFITYHVLRAFVERQYYQLQLSERAYRQKTVELLALQSQMNPHFLFNTLEAVNWQILSETGKPGPAHEMIDSLARIVKYALRSPTTFVPLSDEIENVNHYLRIQTLRQQVRFDLEIDVDERTRGASMVPMTLQPLVENSIVHGFRKRKSGRIKIHTSVVRDKLLLQVTDNGKGVSQELIRKLMDEIALDKEPSGENVGLVNTVRRLRLAFDSRIPVRLDSAESGGFRVEFEIPFRPQ